MKCVMKPLSLTDLVARAGELEREDTLVALVIMVALAARKVKEDTTKLYLVSKIPVAAKSSVTMILLTTNYSVVVVVVVTATMSAVVAVVVVMVPVVVGAVMAFHSRHIV